MGVPWTPISVIWAFNENTLAPFSSFGVWTYSLITYSLIVGIYIFTKKKTLALALFSPFFLTIFFSSLGLKNYDSVPKNINVKIIQPNIQQRDKWDKDKTIINLEKLLKLTFDSGTKDLDLVVWPETAVLFNIQENNQYNMLLQDKLKNLKNVVVGAIRRETFKNENRIFNSLFLIKEYFDLNLYHDKLKLVPFGEYIPFRNFIEYNKILLGGIDFHRGDNLKVLNLNENVIILPLICMK